MKAEIPETTVEAIAAACRGCGVWLLEAKAQGASSKRLKLEVIIDSETGITHEDCRNVDAALDALVATDNFLAELFAIDVLSPGADRPLTQLWQFPKHIGRTLEITLKSGEKHIGKLRSITDTTIEFVPTKHKKAKDEPQVTSVDFAEIASSVVQITF